MENKNIKFLTIAALTCAISIIIFVLGMYLPFLSIITIIGIPFATVIVDLKTDIKYTIIYILATFLIASIINLQESIFYILPNLITGLLFGFLIKLKIHGFFCLMITSLSTMILNLLSIELINLIYSINFVEVLSTFFSLSVNVVESIKLILFFLLGVIQNLLIFFILENELPKFSFNAKDDYSIFYPLLIIGFITSLLGILLNTPLPSISYLLTGISVLSVTNLIFYYLKSNVKWLTFAFISLIFINFFMFIFLNDYFNNNGYYLFFNVITLSICLIGVILIIDKVLINKEILNNDFFITQEVKEKEDK